MPPRTRVLRPALLIAGLAAIATGVVVAVFPSADATTTATQPAAIPAVELPATPTTTAAPVRSVAVGESIQAAIDQAAAAGGGTVLLSAGTHQVSAPIVLRSGITLAGQGQTRTGLATLQNTLGPDMLVMLDGRSGGLSNVVLQNVTLDCALTDAQRRYTADPDRNFGVSISDTSAPNRMLLFDNVQITGCAVGLNVQGAADLTIRNSAIHNNGGSATHVHNVYLRRTSRVAVDNSVLTASPSGNGLAVSHSENVTIRAVTASGNALRGIQVTESSRVEVRGCVTANNADTGILLDSDPTGVRLFRIHANVSTGNKVGIATSAGSNHGEVWGNTTKDNTTDLSLNSSATSVR